MNPKKKAIIILTALLLGAAAWNLFSPRKTFLYSGVVEATEMDIPSRLSAPIAELKTDEGRTVRAGDTLAKLDCSEYLLALELAKKDYERTIKLSKSGSASQENLDRAKYQRDNAELKASWCEVKAPSGAVVLYKHKELGEMTAPGSKIFTLADLGTVWAYVYVPQDKASALKIGAPVKAYLPELGMREFSGAVSVINDKAEFTPKNVQTREERTRLVFGVKITFPNPDGVLKPGMTLEAELP